MTYILINILILVIIISTLFLVATFGFYGIFLLLYSRKGRQTTQNPIINFNPTVSIILPTFNEGIFIKNKIKNLLQTNYNKSKIEIIIADDSKDEESISVIKDILNKHSKVLLSKSHERRGYSKALLDAFQIAKGEIIIITDSGSFFDKDTINELIQPLTDPKIGGVTGSAHILNENKNTGKAESYYRRIYNFMRKSESNADSTFHFHGEVSSVRKELLKGLRYFPANLDIAIAFHIRKQGFKVLFNPDAKFFEYSPETYNERYKQKYFRATGVIKIINSHKKMFSFKNGIFGIIIYPAHFSMMIICPIFICLDGLAFLLLSVISIDVVWAPIIVFCIIVASLFLIKRELVTNFVQLELVLLRAIWKAFTDKSDVIFIEKIDSTRQ